MAKTIFKKSEIFHAWVNQDGLSHYKSTNSYSSIVGYDNLIMNSTNYTLSGAKGVKLHKSLVSEICKDNSRYIIAIIDRDAKKIIIRPHNLEYSWSLTRTLPEGYTIYNTDIPLEDYDILEDEERCLKLHTEYLIRQIYEREYKDAFLLLGGYIRNIKDPYEIFGDEYNIRSESPYALPNIIGFKKFIDANDIARYSWYNDILFDNFSLTKYRGYTSSAYSFKNTKSVRDVYNDTLFSKEELLKIYQHIFYTNYCYGYGTPLSDVKLKWEDSDWKESIVTNKNRIDSEAAAKIEWYKEFNKKSREEAIAKVTTESNVDYLKSWRDTAKISTISIEYDCYIRKHRSEIHRLTKSQKYLNVTDIFNTTQLRLSNPTTVATSRFCTVPLKSAIRLYKLIEIELLKSSDISPSGYTCIRDYRDLDIKCGVYKLLELYCDIKPNTSRLEFCVVIGCHHLWMDDIKDFINYYELNKEFELC